MDELYRGHELVLRREPPRCVIIIELESGAPLPTNITFWSGEGDRAGLDRARRLIDTYLDGPRIAGRRASQSLTL
jgi:hypothetical protein